MRAMTRCIRSWISSEDPCEEAMRRKTPRGGHRKRGSPDP